MRFRAFRGMFESQLLPAVASNRERSDRENPIGRMASMSSIARRVALFVISLALAQIAAEQLAGSAAAGDWGFDLAGADFAKNPGDDFFRYGNGAWYDRALIPRDRSSIGVYTALNISAAPLTRAFQK